jgi:homoserine O-acetyltransferase/O-succinyltransferase
MRIARAAAAAFAVAILSHLMSVAAMAAEPVRRDGTWTALDFKFHTGEVMPELRLGYTTLGEPTADPVLVLHGTTGSAASMLGAAFGGELFGAGQPLDASNYYIIIPDAIGHGRSSNEVAPLVRTDIPLG